MNRFVEVTVNGYKILLNLECVMDVEEIFDGSCRINFGTITSSPRNRMR